MLIDPFFLIITESQYDDVPLYLPTFRNYQKVSNIIKLAGLSQNFIWKIFVPKDFWWDHSISPRLQDLTFNCFFESVILSKVTWIFKLRKTKAILLVFGPEAVEKSKSNPVKSFKNCHKSEVVCNNKLGKDHPLITQRCRNQIFGIISQNQCLQHLYGAVVLHTFCQRKRLPVHCNKCFWE